MDSKMHLEIVGSIKDRNFHVAKSIAEGLKQKFPEAFLDPKIQPFLDCDWHTYLCNKKRELRGEVWQYSSSLMCFLNGLLLGNEKDLASWAKNQWSFTFARPQAFYMALTEDYYTKHLQKTGHQFVFMDIQIAGEAAGRLLFELFSDVCPKTSKNFEALCTGERGLSQSGLPLCYKGSVFHRVVPNGWVQGGGVVYTSPIFRQKEKAMVENQSMEQRFKMRALPCHTLNGALLEWPIRVPTPMDPSSTSPCSQHPGWTGPMLPLVKWLRVLTSSGD
ncbi:probable inactive peptidyl-prolyl cis-trans isomerase-like 6 isoform X5 [Micropterus dolomieu]|uniref:probable inactive peptidyl-prolyl cis-trans isomerase-like 6 isoform X5 n=1 Tax=Micropterus dolomieu TaxID=147949 RepID=UPI001E8DF320|nr:probable inactive peptidyl-prolyl cis-trans isomerase-like 6 isoform X5 [Micropterus dolomieu]